MKIDVLTLFPDMFLEFKKESIIGRAIKDSKVIINIHNIRDYTLDKHNRVDDYPYGGGQGMVLMVEPIKRAIDSVRTSESLIIMLTPQGKQYNQKKAYELTKYKHIILLCGHYEGFDERIRTFVDLELSIGDYVLTGGELASMVIIDSVVRLLDGVIKEDSHLNDSFSDNLLDYPVYTHPAIYENMKVPDVLLSGNHALIDKWRREQSIKNTKNKRPDLLEERDV